MFAGSSELIFDLILDAKTWWLMVPLRVADHLSLAMVFDTGSPLSGISHRTRDALAVEGLLFPVGRNRYLLRNLAIEGQPLPDLTVRLSRRATAVGAEGLLGLDFLNQFKEVHCDIPTLRLTLRR